MTDREPIQMALDALEHGLPIIEDFGGKEQLQLQHKAIAVLYEALRAALAQPEPEPFAYIDHRIHGWPDCFVMQADPPHTSPLYTAPPQREFIGLTDEEILEEYRQSYGDDGNLTDIYFAHAIEAKLKEKNGD